MKLILNYFSSLMIKFYHILPVLTVYKGLRLLGRIEGIDKLELKYYINWFKYLKLYYFFVEGNLYFTKIKKVYRLFLNNYKGLFVNDYFMGYLYGYPKCCVRSVVQSGILYKDNRLKEIEFVIKNSNFYEYPYYMNFISFYRLYFHIPCSLDCKITLFLAKNNFKLLSKYLKSFYKFNLVGIYKLSDKIYNFY